RSSYIACCAEAAFEKSRSEGLNSNSKCGRLIAIMMSLGSALASVVGTCSGSYAAAALPDLRPIEASVAMADDRRSRVDVDSGEIAALTTRVLAAWRKRLRRRKDGHPRTSDRG